MRIDDGGSAPTGPQDWTNSIQSVTVDVSSLREYYFAMIKIAGDAAGPVGSTLAPMSEMIREGLLTSGDPGAGTFQEGKVVADIQYQNLSDFTNFLHDAAKGVNCIGSAAAVIGEMYRNADGSNSAQLGDIAFAFADPGAKVPDSFPKGANTQTYSELAASQSDGGQFAMAASGDDSLATQTIYPASGVTILLFPDGSTKQITSQSGYGYEGTGSKTTTEIYYQGKYVGSEVNEDYSVPGYSYSVRTQSPTDNPTAPGATSTTTRTNPDGSTTIYTTTYDADGHPHDSNPITVQPDTHATNSDAGPVQTAEQQYGTSGTQDYTQTYGNSY